MAKPLSFYLCCLFIIIFPLGMWGAVIGMMSQHAKLEKRLSAIEIEQKEFHEYLEENLKEIYMLYSQNASRTRTIMNMSVRNYHHIAGHPETTSFCPECYDIVRRKGEAIPPKPKE